MSHLPHLVWEMTAGPCVCREKVDPLRGWIWHLSGTAAMRSQVPPALLLFRVLGQLCSVPLCGMDPPQQGWSVGQEVPALWLSQAAGCD